MKKTLASLTGRFFGKPPAEDGEPPSGELQDYRDIQKNLGHLYSKRIHQVMLPRTNMVTIESRFKLSKAVELIKEHGHSRLPVITANNADEIVGILYAKDIFTCLSELTTASVSSIMKKPVFVSYMQPLHLVLEELKERRTQIAVVVDEYGGVGGMVTVEDIIEQLFGNMEDEHDLPQDAVVANEGGFTDIDGKYTLDDFNKLFGTSIGKEGIETIGGYVCHAMEKIPQAGEKIPLADHTLTVLEGDNRHITRLRMHATPVS